MSQHNTIDVTRHFFYAFFSLCFIPSRINDRKEDFLKMLDTITEGGLNETVTEMSEALKRLHQENNILEEEYNRLFADPFKATAGMSASYYFEGYESGKMLEKTRDILCTLGVVREKDFSEPEDHFGCLFDSMAYAINLRLSAKEGECGVEELEKKLFTEVINPNIEFLMADIFDREDCEAYIDVCTILHSFLAFERNQFGVEAPKEQSLSKVVDLGEYYKKKKKKSEAFS